MQPLTYLAQVRQLPFKNVWLYLHPAPIAPRILAMKPSKKLGTSLKEIVIIGTVPDAAWVVRNRSMAVWLKDAGRWHKTTRYFLSLSRARGGK